MARPARSLDVLLAEVNAIAPHRSKVSDGWLGDAAHQARASRHNPNDAGVVTARDITDDPEAGMPVHVLARALVARQATHPHPDFEYVISNRQVARRRTGWTWAPYTGENPHTKHAHFAVGRGPDSEPTPPYDDTIPWGVAAALNQEDDDMPTLDEIEARVRKVLDEATAFGLTSGAATIREGVNLDRAIFNSVAAVAKAIQGIDGVDEKALAAEIVLQVQGVLLGLPDAELEKLPALVADELDRRQRERLGAG